jgi:hypothetical protein
MGGFRFVHAHRAAEREADEALMSDYERRATR